MMTIFSDSKLNNKEFADRIGVAPTYFGQIKKGAANKGRNIGNVMAKRIESAFSKPSGWLDIDHSNVDGIDQSVNEEHANYQPVDSDEWNAILNKVNAMSPSEREEKLKAIALLLGEDVSITE